MKLVCFGDSITESGANGGWTDWLQHRLGAAHQVVNSGIGGNTTSLALERIASDVLLENPGIVIIEFGINDAYVLPDQFTARVSQRDYERNLREIIRLAQSSGAVPILVVNHFPMTGGVKHRQGNQKPLEDNLAAYNAIVRRLARELRLEIVDLPEFLTHISMDDFLDSDGVHLSRAGQFHFGQAVWNKLNLCQPDLKTTAPK